MKDVLLKIIQEYLLLFPNEIKRQEALINFLNKFNDEEIINWNNFSGHITAGGIIYAKEEKKFLVLYHKDLKIYTYPGGHVDQNDKNILETSIRETLEETGLIKLNQIKLKNNKLIPIDIDTHVIEYNERLDLPQHYHFDFRYLFTIEKMQNIKIDYSESVNYKWIDINEFKEDKNCVELIDKLNNYCE